MIYGVIVICVGGLSKNACVALCKHIFTENKEVTKFFIKSDIYFHLS